MKDVSRIHFQFQGYLRLLEILCGKRKRKLVCRAYMTVEAALLLPMVLCVIVIGIYTAFLLYDRCLFCQDAYILCLRESYRKDEGEPEADPDKVLESASDLLGNKYFAVDTMSASAEADGIRVSYEGSAVIAPAVFGSYFLMPQSIWNISFSAASRKNDPAWTIRNWRRKSRLIQTGIELISGDTDS